jgi:putative pyoverdin transport system ATP-binding/permease protein
LIAACLDGRPIHVYDECAAEQDPVFRRFFYTKFLPELKASGKAVLVITHDDSFFPYADRRIKLDWGKLEEVG